MIARRAGRARRARALLAGCLVFGVGATATAASWTDRHYGHGVFRTAFLAVESTTAVPYTPAGPWVEAETGTAGPALAFDATGMYPGTSAYAPIAVRTRPGSVAGTMTLGGAEISSSGTSSADLGAALRYRVIHSASCEAAAFTAGADYLVGGDRAYQPLTMGQSRPEPLRLSSGAPGQPGAPVHLCFHVTLPTGAANDLQGHTAQAVWRLTTTSSS